MPTADSHIILWKAMKEGDRDALAKLFSVFYPVLNRYGIKFCNDSSLLEDCIQDLFAEIWKSQAGSEVVSVQAYLFKSLKYKIYKKKAQTYLPSNATNLEDDAFEISHDNFMVAEEENKERVDRVITALSQLPSRQREIIYLKIYQQLSYEEVCEVMNLNYQVCRNLMSQAIKSLKKIMIASLVLLVPALV